LRVYPMTERHARPTCSTGKRESLDKPARRWHDLAIQADFEASIRFDSMTDALATQRKRLRFRSWHRGLKELDLLVGSFADAHLADFDAAQLALFEEVLDLPEPALYAWLLGRAEAPTELDNEVLDLLLAYEYEPPAR